MSAPALLFKDRPVSAVPDVDASTILSTLATMSSTTFATAQECVDTYLAALPSLINMRTVYVSQLTADTAYIIGVQTNNGCPVPADGTAPLEETFCQYVRASGAPVIVTDAEQDVRVSDVLIRELFRIKSYVGVPIYFSDGTLYGTLCALDPEARHVHHVHVDALRLAARHIGQMIERDAIDRSRQVANETVAVQQDALDQQTTLLHTVAHDLRSPLSGICGFAELLSLPHFGSLSLRQQEMVGHIRRSGQFMNRLVTDLVDVAASEGRTLMLLAEAFDANDIGQHVVDATREVAVNRGLDLTMVGVPGGVSMVADSTRLQQVLLNLVNNALRYTQHGHVTLRILTQNDTVVFEVEDTGPGIPPDQIGQIWERHVRASSIGRGLGLGLYIVRRLTEAMDGTVELRSEFGVGSTFGIRLPLHGPRPKKIQW